MEKRSIKLAVTVICVLAAGICYSCGGAGSRADEGQMLVFDESTAEGLSEDGARTGAAGSAETESESAQVPDRSAETLSGDAAQAPADEAGRDLSQDVLEGAEENQAALCFVHICGAVVNPGVYEVPCGSRIFEVVEAAGGFTEEAASSYLNLAQEIADGMKIVVPEEEELSTFETGAGEYGVFFGGTSAEAAGVPAHEAGKVNINTADRSSLMTLSGIGETKADDIIRYREANGPFESIQDIMKVPGIKEAAFEKIKDDITV